jgi:hypothetical protein
MNLAMSSLVGTPSSRSGFEFATHYRQSALTTTWPSDVNTHQDSDALMCKRDQIRSRLDLVPVQAIHYHCESAKDLRNDHTVILGQSLYSRLCLKSSLWISQTVVLVVFILIVDLI